MASARPCRKCKMPTRAGQYCERCAVKVQAKKTVKAKAYDNKRGSAAQRGYGWEWQKESKSFLFLPENRFCVRCKAKGLLTMSTLVDHIKPHKGNAVLFWDRSNWQGLCVTCHNKKTATEDGGFGR